MCKDKNKKMSEEFEIRNKVAENTSLVNFDLASLQPKGKKNRNRHKKTFFFQELILREKRFPPDDFRSGYRTI